jgi:hypothetical protein
MAMNAYIFKRDVLDKQDPDSVYGLFTGNLSYYFFSHLHNLEIVHLEYPILIDHLYEFLNFFLGVYKGESVAMAYSEFYKEKSKAAPELQTFVWNVLYSMSIFHENSKELQSIIITLEDGKRDTIKFLTTIRQSVADINSMNVKDTYLDILPLDSDRLHLYFSAVYGPKSVHKMPLLKKISAIYRKNTKIYGADLALILLDNLLQNKKNFKFINSEVSALS